VHENGHNNYVMFMFIQFLGKYQGKDIKIYIEPLIDELLKLRNDITMYEISRPIRHRQFQFHAMLVWTIHDAPRLTHF
jgi:hypothetical protein